MIILAALILGAIWGGTLAARRKGNRADIAQYAFGFAMAFGLAGFVVTLILEKALL